jgi:hypothetical protein
MIWRAAATIRWRARPLGRALLIVAAVLYFGYLLYTREDVANLPSLIRTPTIVERFLHGRPLWERPATAPNGSPWPGMSGYVAGYPRLNVGGLAEVVVDNSGGADDLFVKLIDRDQKPMTAVRVVFLKAGDKVKLDRVQPAHYDVRYRALDTGVIRRSPTIAVSLRVTANGQQYMGWTVPVYETVLGRIHHEEISEREF